MRKALIVAAFGFGLSALVPSPIPAPYNGAALALPDTQIGREALANRRLREIERSEERVRHDRDALPQCAANACLTPSEAAAVAFTMGPDQRTAGRFILDVRAGTGPSNPNQLHTEDLYYLSSDRGFSEFGTLVLAIEPESLRGLIRAAGGEADKRPSVSRMMKALSGKRVIVDGEVGLQWVEHRYWQTGLRTGRGHHQVWVRVTSPDQITVVGPA